MDIARFHRGIDAIIDAYQTAEIQATLDSITNSLTNLGSNPGNVELAQEFKKSLQELKNKLEKLESIESENSVKETLESINSDGIFGSSLFKNIQDNISQNQISPTLAAQAIGQTKSAFKTKIAHLTAINNAFHELEINYDFIDQGSTEILVKIPIEQDTKLLSDLANESKDWHQIFSTISEVFDPDRPNVSINGIGTASWIFYLTATPLVLLGISISLRRVNQILSELIKMKQLAKQLLEIKAPTLEIEKHIENKMASDIKIIADELVESNYKGTDSGRKNELKTAMNITLKNLVKKISTGSKINLQLEDKEKPSIQNDENISPDEKKLIEDYDQFQKIRNQLQSEIALTHSIDGASDLLHLIQNEESEKSDSKFS